MGANNDLFLDIVEFNAKSGFVSDELELLTSEQTGGLSMEYITNLLKCRILEQQLNELKGLLSKHKSYDSKSLFTSYFLHSLKYLSCFINT